MLFKRNQKQETKHAASLYFGNVMHARLKPRPHRFNYKIFSLLIDLDRFNDASAMSAIFSVNKANLVSFHEKDHGPRDGSSLRAHINKLLLDGGMEIPARVFLWCNPRILGYTFNPLSIYFCENEHGETTALVYQVHNTFGQSHNYVAMVDPAQNADASIRNSAEKCFYVSPFLEMDMRYDFRIRPPDEKLRIRILENDKEGPILSATFSGERSPLNSLNLAFGTLKTFGLAWKIIAGIHFEALLIWFKGIKLQKRPNPPKMSSYIKRRKNLVPGE